MRPESGNLPLQDQHAKLFERLLEPGGLPGSWEYNISNLREVIIKVLLPESLRLGSIAFIIKQAIHQQSRVVNYSPHFP